MPSGLEVQIAIRPHRKLAPLRTDSAPSSPIDHSSPFMLMLYSPTEPRQRGSAKPGDSAPRSKNASSFDFLSLLDALPPNTGPPGTATVTNGAGSLSNANKNLSHVPCKFFKQGICQAGKSCPFSHNLDGSLAADKLPCKYFQKGNCKFGLKCALAHFLPDGTRVNSKGLLSRRNDRYERSNSSQANPQATVQPSSSLKAADPPTKNLFDLCLEPIEIKPTLAPSDADEFSALGLFQNSSLSMHSSYGSAFAQGSSFATSDWLTNYSSNLFGNGTNGSLLGSGFTTSNSPPGNLMSGESLALSDPSGSLLTSPQNMYSYLRPFSKYQLSASSSPLYNYSRMLHEDSAIADDESETLPGDDDAYFEDYVPASIGNLIFTPQEQQRRESRSQSGTLLVRPTAIVTPTQEKRTSGFFGPRAKGDDVFLME